jgi:hypothetical protein
LIQDFFGAKCKKEVGVIRVKNGVGAETYKT